jgi:hypothetical protein
LGELSPIGKLFTFSFFKNTEVSLILGLRFSTINAFDTTLMGWATSWATFSQTHLVTPSAFVVVPFIVENLSLFGRLLFSHHFTIFPPFYYFPAILLFSRHFTIFPPFYYFPAV